MNTEIRKWNMDSSSGLYGSKETAYYYDSLNRNYVEWDEYNLLGILKSLCRNEEFCRKFYDNYIRIVDTCFALQKEYKLPDSYTGTYEEATKATLKLFWGTIGGSWLGWPVQTIMKCKYNPTQQKI